VIALRVPYGVRADGLPIDGNDLLPVALVAVVVAVPIGVVVGRLLWLLFTDRLGVPYEPTVPLGRVLALVVGALAVALAVAIGPAVQAARIRPGPALRAE